MFFLRVISAFKFQKGSGLGLVAFADADYASKATDRTSVSGRVVMCAGAFVCRFSRTQKPHSRPLRLNM